MESIRKVAISRIVFSRTMSAADRLRSWRSAGEKTCRDNSGGGGRANAVTAIRHRWRKHRNGQQTRSNTQVPVGPHKNKAGSDTDTAPVDTKQTARPAVNHGLLAGRADGQRQLRRRGPQSRLMERNHIGIHTCLHNSMHSRRGMMAHSGLAQRDKGGSCG